MADGYAIEIEQAPGCWEHFASYGLELEDAFANARWYNWLLRGKRRHRVVLNTGESKAVICG